MDCLELAEHVDAVFDLGQKIQSGFVDLIPADVDNLMFSNLTKLGNSVTPCCFCMVVSREKVELVYRHSTIKEDYCFDLRDFSCLLNGQKTSCEQRARFVHLMGTIVAAMRCSDVSVYEIRDSCKNGQD
ncbi:MAG: hypothetical protein VW378_04555 [bacterium]